MSDLPQISEAEFEVMKIVWKHAPISTNEITDKLLQTTSWSPKTIQTLIKRLVTKGALTYEKTEARSVCLHPSREKKRIRPRKPILFWNNTMTGDITAMLSAYIEILTDCLKPERKEPESQRISWFLYSFELPLFYCMSARGYFNLLNILGCLLLHHIPCSIA